MKTLKYLAFSILCLLVSNQNIDAQTFVKKDGSATDVAISPKDGSVYVVGSSKNVFKYNTSSKSFKPFGKQSKNVKSIAVHSNGSLYMVSTSNEVYIDINGRWNKIPGIKTNEVDIDKNGNIRALNLSGKLYNLYQGKWQLKPLVNKNTSGFNQVIGQDSKTLYARFKNNSFKQFKSGKWVTLNGSPLKITMDDKTGEVYAVGRNKGIYKWNKTSKKWILLKGTRKDFEDLAVNNGKIWGVTNDKAIYIYDKNKKPSVEKAKDYTGTYRVTFTRIVGNTETSQFNKTVYLYGTMGTYLEAEIASGMATIRPADNKKNRMFDVSKDSATRMRDIDRETVRGLMTNGKYTSGYYVDVELELDTMREFEILGEAANDKLTFDFQTNLKWKRHLDEVDYKWQRNKYDIDKIPLGKENFIRLRAENNLDGNWVRLYLGFKIEKN